MTSAPPVTNTSRVAESSSDVLDERRRLAGRVLIDALLLGVVGDALLRVPSWGVNITLWTLAIVVALFTLARRRSDAISADARWLVVPAVALSLLFLWRDSEGLTAYTVLAWLGTAALLATAVAKGSDSSIATSRVRDLIGSAANVGAGAVFGMLPLVFSDVSLRDVAHARATTRVVTGIRAALIAIPLLLVFGGLFASADPVFARIAGNMFRLDAEEVASHLILTGFIAWGVGGALRTAVLTNGQPMVNVRFPDGALGLTEVSVALGSLTVLFAAFVAVQLRYFFGGDALVQQTAGMSYADYARRGFFELVAVAALVLPVLLSANALLRRDSRAAARTYRVLATTLVALLAVIMYSAMARMWLYQSVYGMSIDRLFATVFMGWLVVVFAWFAATVLRGRDKRFASGTLVSAWGAIIALNVADPAGLVTRVNVARAAQGKELDVLYHSELGADAMPALAGYLASQPLTPPPVRLDAAPAADSAVTSKNGFGARCMAARIMLNRWDKNVSRDWRSWTIAHAQARRAVAANRSALETLAKGYPNEVTTAPCSAPPPPPAAVPAADVK